MKKIKQLFALLFLITITFSCGDDDDSGDTTPITQNGITISGNFIPTPNAYLILDRGISPFEDSFFFALSNGTMVNDSNEGVFSSTNTTTVAALHIAHNGTVTLRNLVNVNTSTYTLEKDNSALVSNITLFTRTYINNGITYGNIDQDSATEYLIENSGFGDLTITAITKDFTNKNGTITCTFTITDDNGVTITGSYSGSYIMLFGDV